MQTQYTHYTPAQQNSAGHYEITQPDEVFALNTPDSAGSQTRVVEVIEPLKGWGQYKAAGYIRHFNNDGADLGDPDVVGILAFFV